MTMGLAPEVIAAQEDAFIQEYGEAYLRWVSPTVKRAFELWAERLTSVPTLKATPESLAAMVRAQRASLANRYREMGVPYDQLTQITTIEDKPTITVNLNDPATYMMREGDDASAPLVFNPKAGSEAFLKYLQSRAGTNNTKPTFLVEAYGPDGRRIPNTLKVLQPKTQEYDPNNAFDNCLRQASQETQSSA